MDKKIRLQKLLKNGNVELRCFDVDGNPRLGIYDDYKIMAKQINYAEQNGYDVYHTINPVNKDATNTALRPFQRGARDADITRIKTIFFDFDPIRDTGTASSLDEKLMARKQAVKLQNYLSEHNWDMPIVGDSGNGYHLYYNVDLPVEYKSKYLDGLYIALEKRFTTDKVGFDVTVRNPARIARCLGTTNRKANRKSKCFFVDNFTHEEQIISLAEKITPPKIKPSHFVKTSDVQNIRPNHNIISDILASGLAVTETPEHGKYWVNCFNASQHSKTGPKDTVVWLNDNGFYTYHCSHSHCSHLTAKDLAQFVGVRNAA